VIGNARTVEQAIEMTRVGGTACIVGMAPQGVRSSFDPLLFVQKETKLIGTWYGSARPRIDFPRMIELTMAGKLKVNELISRRYTLDQINEGFDRLGRGEVARGVIVF
jgi:Zn-dependent alcohol dehydrogenase